MDLFRAIVRLITFGFLSVYFASLIVIDRALSPRDAEVVPDYFRRWARATMRVLGIQVRVRGAIPLEAALIMPNHRCYTDALFFQAWIQCCYAATVDVRQWPLIGWGADKVNTLWINPNNRRKIRQNIREKLEQDYSVVFFPGMTTRRSPEVGDFQPGMFEIAAEGKIPIVPVAIDYQNSDVVRTGSDRLLPHLLKCFGKRKTEVRLVFGPRIHGADGEQLKKQTYTWIQAQLDGMSLSRQPQQTFAHRASWFF